MTNVIDATQSDVSVIILNNKSWEEFYSVKLPSGLSERKRKQAENRLVSSGFREEYEFIQKIVDRRSLSLAKAQATSLAKRISDKTGLKMEVQHGLHVTG